MDGLLVAPITKIDKDRREVWGYATLEVPDKTTPIPDVMDYQSAVEAFSQWPGNVREMHLPVAIGKAVQVLPDPEKRGIYVGARISESRDGQDVWQKIEEGILTSFSIGAKGITRTPELLKVDGKDMTINRLRAKSIVEVSLVDNPACPGTQFSVAKAEETEAQGGGEAEKTAAVAPKRMPILTGTAKALFTPDAIKCQVCDIGTALNVLGGLLVLVDSESMSQAMGEQDGAELATLTAAFRSVHDFIAQELQELLTQRAPASGAQMALQPEETKMTQADVTKAVETAMAGVKTLVADALKDLAGKADLTPLSENVQQATAAAEAVQTDLAALAKRVEKMEASPASGGPVLRTADVAGLSAVTKRTVTDGSAGEAVAQSATSILADIDKQIEAERDPRKKETLGQLYTALAIKYRI